MNKELHSILGRLINDYLNLRHTWEEFNRLFSADQKNIELMNSIAPGFFGMVQGMMIESIILGLSRMTDGDRSGQHMNLSLPIMLSVPYDEIRDHIHEIKPLIESAALSAGNARHWRNKRTAHTDLLHSDDDFKIGYDELRDAIDTVYKALNRISQAVHREPLPHEITKAQGGASSLLAALNQLSNTRTFIEV